MEPDRKSYTTRYLEKPTGLLPLCVRNGQPLDSPFQSQTPDQVKQTADAYGILESKLYRWIMAEEVLSGLFASPGKFRQENSKPLLDALVEETLAIEQLLEGEPYFGQNSRNRKDQRRILVCNHTDDWITAGMALHWTGSSQMPTLTWFRIYTDTCERFFVAGLAVSSYHVYASTFLKPLLRQAPQKEWTGTVPFPKTRPTIDDHFMPPRDNPEKLPRSAPSEWTLRHFDTVNFSEFAFPETETESRVDVNQDGIRKYVPPPEEE